MNETSPDGKIKTARKRLTLRRAIADYMQSEGCSCCRGQSHEADKSRVAELLNVPRYSDGSGWNFNRFCTKPTRFEGDEVA